MHRHEQNNIARFVAHLHEQARDVRRLGCFRGDAGVAPVLEFIEDGLDTDVDAIALFWRAQQRHPLISSVRTHDEFVSEGERIQEAVRAGEVPAILAYQYAIFARVLRDLRAARERAPS